MRLLPEPPEPIEWPEELNEPPLTPEEEEEIGLG